jgi:hypothetical protein
MVAQGMTITLTKAKIEAALPRVSAGLEKYLWLQAQRDICDLRSSSEYRQRFNGFYRVRRGRDWQDRFYDLLEGKKGEAVSFAEVLDSLHRRTGRYEASFAIKLLATLDPNMPVIDSIVLRNLNLRLPASSSPQRIVRIQEIHSKLENCFKEFLTTEMGRHLVERFRTEYPTANITEVKMLDLVLWQTRPMSASHRTARKRRSAPLSAANQGR